MGVVHALLHRIWKLPYSQQAEVPNSVKKELISMSHLLDFLICTLTSCKMP